MSLKKKKKKPWDLFLEQRSINKDPYPSFPLSPKTKCASNFSEDAMQFLWMLSWKFKEGKIKTETLVL